MNTLLQHAYFDAGYDKNNATIVGCWAHARRDLDDAQKSMGKHKSGKLNCLKLWNYFILVKLQAVTSQKRPSERCWPGLYYMN